MNDFYSLSASNTAKKVLDQNSVTRQNIIPLIEQIVDKLVENSGKPVSLSPKDIRSFANKSNLNPSVVNNVFMDSLEELGYVINSGSQYNETYITINLPKGV